MNDDSKNLYPIIQPIVKYILVREIKEVDIA